MRYYALPMLSALLKVAALPIFGLGAFMFISNTRAQDAPGVIITQGLFWILGGLFVALLSYALGELIDLVMSIDTSLMRLRQGRGKPAAQDAEVHWHVTEPKESAVIQPKRRPAPPQRDDDYLQPPRRRRPPISRGEDQPEKLRAVRTYRKPVLRSLDE